MHFVVVLAAASSRVSYSMTERFAEPVMCSVPVGSSSTIARTHDCMSGSFAIPHERFYSRVADSSRTCLYSPRLTPSLLFGYI
ncbi:hypothetical protein B0H14DRAFT_2734057, partial [Mycena olivaceomarginata]